MDSLQIFMHCLVFLSVYLYEINCLTCQTPDGPCKCTTDQGEMDLTPLDGTGSAKFPGVTGQDSDIYNYNPCTDLSDTNCYYGPTMVCFQDYTTFSWYVAGSQSSATWASSSDGSGDLAVTVKQTDYDGIERSTEITYHCDENDEGSVTADNANGNNFKLKLNTKYACVSGGTGGAGSSGISIGTILLIMFVVLVFIYVAGGILFLHFVKGANGSEMIPNLTFWKEVPVLIKDGTVYVVDKVKGSPSTSASKSEYQSFS